MSIAPAPQLLAHRWFFALKPDDITARRTHVFAEEELGAKGLLRPDHHHVTLALTQDFADLPDGLVDMLLRAGDAVMAAPFNLLLDRLVGSNKSVALRSTGAIRLLRALQASIATAMTRHGIALRPGWTFSPHETLCYRKGKPFIQPVTGFRWTVSEFVLVHSFIGLSRHETIGRWPLRPPDDPQGTLF
jgi:2'-5' RNA ligase